MTDSPNVKPFQRPVRVETYKAQMYCGKCHRRFQVQVPKGTLCTSVSWTCPNCGCTKEQVESEVLGQQARVQVAKGP